MAVDDDDSWEIAAQAALEIHRRVISTVRDRATAGPGRRKKVIEYCTLPRKSAFAKFARGG